jgi:hypothetical protein
MYIYSQLYILEAFPISRFADTQNNLVKTDDELCHSMAGGSLAV